MKKNLMIAAAALLISTATLHAQVDSTKPVISTTETHVKKDQWNTKTSADYKMLDMPAPLTTDKIFPVLGRYELTNAEGAAASVTVSLDETNKGIIWVDGLPQGRIKAILRQSPTTYKIPAQKIGEEKDAKDVAEGVLIYDKDANVLNVCIGCTYNVENPAVAFAPQEQPVVEEAPKKVTKTSKKAVAKKEVKVKPLQYTGSKIIETTAAVPAQQL